MWPFPSRFVPPLGPPKGSARERVLAQWRGIDLAPIERAGRHQARAASDVIPNVLKDLRIDRRLSEAQILKVWNESIDPNITAHAQPTGVRKGLLFVSVDSNVWLAEIVRYRRREILERLQHSFGHEMVQRIMFRVVG
jgi:hypothetical protein